MGSIRNFEYLILIKQLFQDGSDSASRDDRLSLTKAMILLDLSVEQTLKVILLNLNPNFLIPKGRNDIGFKDLWREASAAIQSAAGTPLPEQNESARLHELRNLVQHNGTEPPPADVRRYVISTGRMLTEGFRLAFGIDFDNLRFWDFVANEDLRRLLNESEQYLKDRNPVLCIIGCKQARDLVIDAIGKYVARGRYSGDSFPSFEAKELGRALGEQARNLAEIHKYIVGLVQRLETEVILIGMGMPIVDTRRFMQLRGATVEALSMSGRMTVRIKESNPNREAETENARFMLNYLYRLIRRAEEDHPGLFDEIGIKLPLSGQKITEIEFKYE